MTHDGSISPLTTRAQWADRRLRLAILTGEIAPGTRIRPGDLAREWDVSATPLREAIHRLAADGLLVESPHRGATVAPLDRGDMLELYELRLLVEPRALEKSLDATDESHREQMRRAHDAWAAADSSPDTDPLTREEAHQRFHRSLLARCPSRRMLAQIDAYSEHSTRYRLAAGSVQPGDARGRKEHRRLLDLCLAGDVGAAADALRDHLMLTVNTVLEREGLQSDAPTT
jgi:GntR family transcriptional regulator, carbon starvation induced regulator